MAVTAVVSLPEASHTQAEVVVRPMRPERFYRPELDLLRLLAFLMVWLSHALLPFAGLLPAGRLALFEGAGSCGVPVFFFLSAYLITELLRREQLATGSIHLGSFYMRRILRIWPLYLGVLALYGLLGLRFHGFRIEPGRLYASLLLAGNWYLVLHPAITTPMRALWSISVEEQWYVLFPVLRRALSRSRLLLLCAAIFALAQLLLMLLAHYTYSATLHVTAWVNSGVQFQYFALGTAAALLLDGRVPGFGRPARAALLAGGAGLILGASGLTGFKRAMAAHSAASLISGYLLVGAGVAMLFFCLFGIRAERCPRALVRLGQLSYGLYVFHETGFFLADALRRGLGAAAVLHVMVLEKLLALALTIAFASASYYAWELPFLRLKRRWTLVRSREAQ